MMKMMAQIKCLLTKSTIQTKHTRRQKYPTLIRFIPMEIIQIIMGSSQCVKLSFRYRNKGIYGVDPRVSVFNPEWIDGKRILDIGCNNGRVALDVAITFSPLNIVGLD